MGAQDLALVVHRDRRTVLHSIVAGKLHPDVTGIRPDLPIDRVVIWSGVQGIDDTVRIGVAVVRVGAILILGIV